MSAVVLGIDEDLADAPPANGGTWEWAWTWRDGTTILADSLTDVLAEMVAGHSDVDDHQALQLRYDAVIELASLAQTAALGDGSGLEGMNESEVNAVMSDRRETLTDVPQWPHAMPLVLNAANYSPITSQASPVGEHVVLLDPMNERTLLEAFEKVGMGSLSQGDGD